MFITLSVFSLIISILNKSSKGTYTCTTQMGFEMQSQKVSMSLSTVKFIKFSALAGILFSLCRKLMCLSLLVYFLHSFHSSTNLLKVHTLAPLRMGFKMQSQKVSMSLSTVKFIKFSALAGILFPQCRKLMCLSLQASFNLVYFLCSFI